MTFDAEGCAPSRAAAAAVAEMVDGAGVLEAAAIGPDDVDAELGGLAATHRHSADLAADALHRALSEAARSGEQLAPPRARAGAGRAERRASTRRSRRCSSASAGRRSSR